MIQTYPNSKQIGAKLVKDSSGEIGHLYCSTKGKPPPSPPSPAPLQLQQQQQQRGRRRQQQKQSVVIWTDSREAITQTSSAEPHRCSPGQTCPLLSGRTLGTAHHGAGNTQLQRERSSSWQTDCMGSQPRTSKIWWSWLITCQICQSVAWVESIFSWIVSRQLMQCEGFAFPQLVNMFAAADQNSTVPTKTKCVISTTSIDN